VSGSTTLHLVIQDVTRKAVSKLPAKLATRKSLGVSPSLVIFLKQVEASCEAGWVRSTPANRSVTVVQHRMNDVIFAALDNIGIAGQSPFALLLLCFSSFLSLGVTSFLIQHVLLATAAAWLPLLALSSLPKLRYMWRRLENKGGRAVATSCFPMLAVGALIALVFDDTQSSSIPKEKRTLSQTKVNE
jgi:hypothetical protein